MMKCLYTVFVLILPAFLIAQRLCDTRIVVWDVQIEQGDEKLSSIIGGVVEEAILQTNEAKVLTRQDISKLAALIESEKNISAINELKDETIQQLKALSANEVVLGTLRQSRFNGEIYLKLYFYELYKFEKNASLSITFTNEEFNNSAIANAKINERVKSLFVCDNEAIEINKVIAELERLEIDRINNQDELMRQYDRRDVIDEALVADKRVRNSQPQLLPLHQSIKELKERDNEILREIQDKEIRRDQLIEILNEQKRLALSQAEMTDSPITDSPPEPESCEEVLNYNCLAGPITKICYSEFNERFSSQYFVQVASFGDTFKECELSSLYSVNRSLYLVDFDDRFGDNVRYALRIGPLKREDTVSALSSIRKLSGFEQAMIYLNGRLYSR